MEELEMLKDLPDVLLFDEYRKVLRIGKNRAYRLLREGTIKSIKIRRRIPHTKNKYYKLFKKLIKPT